MRWNSCYREQLARAAQSPSVVPTVGALSKRRGFCTDCGARLHDGAGCTSDGSCAGAQTCPPDGAEFLVSATFCIGQSTASDGQGVECCKPCDLNMPAWSELIKKQDFKVPQAHTGAVTLIKCCGLELKLNLHFQELFIDGGRPAGRKVLTMQTTSSGLLAARRATGVRP